MGPWPDRGTACVRSGGRHSRPATGHALAQTTVLFERATGFRDLGLPRLVVPSPAALFRLESS
jgi:hypothetical protein